MRARVFYLLFLMIFVSCTTDDNRNYVEIPVGQYKEFSPATPSEVYDVEPIYIQLPFRGGENSSFGSIEKVIVRNDILYIEDFSRKRLITRPVSGGAYSVLDYRGRGPNEYLQISDFDVDAQGNIWILDAQKDIIAKYSRDFEFIQSWPVEFQIDKIRCLPSGGFAFQIAIWDDSQYRGNQLAFTDSAFAVEKVLLQYPKGKDDNFVFHNVFSDCGNGFFYCEPIDDHLYHISDDGIVQNIYSFDFGMYTVPERYKKDIERHYEVISKDHKFIFLTYGVTPSYITCGLNHNGWNAAIFDRKNQTLAMFNRKESGFMLVGHTSLGPIWQIDSNAAKDCLPEEVVRWLDSGDDVLTIYPINE